MRPKFDGDGDGDLLEEGGGVNGAIGRNVLAVGEIGDSSRLAEDDPYFDFGVTVDDELWSVVVVEDDEPDNASKV